MKQIRQYLVLLLIAVIFVTGLTTELYSNLFGVLTGNGFIIPEQSSILTFKVNKMNEGSGDYWLYGEDPGFYYTTMQANNNMSYIFIPKEKAGKIESFDKVNYKTWGIDQ
ncbi:hypothetical protein LVD17_16425 [Fulvivirga ulvae]|uniref:hypothetical protein n=1 Tax=Fulvivirga ulvae TaxID=2904245 RepID=UPI001F2DB648|nr:hypothetical protein [Fulvivirga ulvae]UII29886.1 hypothetical protein LVD17_16425 [Fulvivirga ulvae]